MNLLHKIKNWWENEDNFGRGLSIFIGAWAILAIVQWYPFGQRVPSADRVLHVLGSFSLTIFLYKFNQYKRNTNFVRYGIWLIPHLSIYYSYYRNQLETLYAFETKVFLFSMLVNILFVVSYIDPKSISILALINGLVIALLDIYLFDNTSYQIRLASAETGLFFAIAFFAPFLYQIRFRDLKKQVQGFTDKIKSLQLLIDGLLPENQSLKQKVNELESKVDYLAEENQTLKQKVNSNVEKQESVKGYVDQEQINRSNRRTTFFILYDEPSPNGHGTTRHRYPVEMKGSLHRNTIFNGGEHIKATGKWVSSFVNGEYKTRFFMEQFELLDN